MERLWWNGRAGPDDVDVTRKKALAAPGVRGPRSRRLATRARAAAEAAGMARASVAPAWFMLAHAVAPFLLGSAIYVLWRAKTILFFSWLRYVGLYAPMVSLRAECAGMKHLIPGFILYSVPDGLWLYAFTALMGVIWFNEPRRAPRACWIALPLVLAIGSEFAQLFKIIPGTFDWWDVFSYLAAWTPAVISIHFFLPRITKAAPLHRVSKTFS